MVDSPQLTFTLEISPKDVEQEVRDDEAAGDKQALDVVKDASEEIAQEDSLVMADEIDATAGVGWNLSADVMDAMNGEIRDVVLNAFEEDSALTDFASAAQYEGALIAAEKDEGLIEQGEQELEQLLEASPEEDIGALASDLKGIAP